MSEELKLVIKRSNPYEKLDFIDDNINDIIPVIEKTDIDYKDIILQKLKRIQDILDRHHGLLLYAKKNYNFDLIIDLILKKLVNFGRLSYSKCKLIRK